MTQLDRTRDSFAKQAVMATLGVSIEELTEGRVILNLPFQSNLTQQHGFLHAGIVTTVLDSACGYAAFTMMPHDAEVLTVEFKSNFLAPARGQSFRFVGQVLKPGRTLVIAEGRAFALDDGKATLISAMQATMMVVQGRKGVNG